MLTTTPYSDLALGRKATSRSRANGYGRNCVPNKDRADFPQVLESRHTIEEQAGLRSRAQSIGSNCAACNTAITFFGKSAFGPRGGWPFCGFCPGDCVYTRGTIVRIWPSAICSTPATITLSRQNITIRFLFPVRRSTGADSGSATVSGWRHTLSGCDDNNWRGLSGPRCLLQPLAQLNQFKELRLEIGICPDEDF